MSIKLQKSLSEVKHLLFIQNNNTHMFLKLDARCFLYTPDWTASGITRWSAFGYCHEKHNLAEFPGQTVMISVDSLWKYECGRNWAVLPHWLHCLKAHCFLNSVRLTWTYAQFLPLPNRPNSLSCSSFRSSNCPLRNCWGCLSCCSCNVTGQLHPYLSQSWDALHHTREFIWPLRHPFVFRKSTSFDSPHENRLSRTRICEVFLDTLGHFLDYYLYLSITAASNILPNWPFFARKNYKLVFVFSRRDITRLLATTNMKRAELFTLRKN